MRFENTHQEALSRIYMILTVLLVAWIFLFFAHTEGYVEHFWIIFFLYLFVALIGIGISIAVIKKREIFQRVLYFQIYSSFLNLVFPLLFLTCWGFYLDEKGFGNWTYPLMILDLLLVLFGFFTNRKKWLKHLDALAALNRAHLKKRGKFYRWDYEQPFEYIKLEEFEGINNFFEKNIGIITFLFAFAFKIIIVSLSSLQFNNLFAYMFLFLSISMAISYGKRSVEIDTLRMIEEYDDFQIVFQQKESDPHNDDWGTVLVKTLSRSEITKRYR